jgi:hypothetical protein
MKSHDFYFQCSAASYCSRSNGSAYSAVTIFMMSEERGGSGPLYRSHGESRGGGVEHATPGLLYNPS